MNDFTIPDDLRALVSEKLASAELLSPGELLSQGEVARHSANFAERFGPQVLAGLDGEALLKAMHGRREGEPRCLMYWLEFKNDEEFPGSRYGGIGGGAATKFGVYQRQSDGAWATGGPTTTKVIETSEAIAIARKQRDELLAGVEVLRVLPQDDISDATYAGLQARMQAAAPELHRSGWAHKYWFLCAPDRLDDFHSPRWQRFHLFKLLQMPPDKSGLLDGNAPRFVCAGRFVTLARELNVPVPALTGALAIRSGSLHRYWRVGTTDGDGNDLWPEMRDHGVASVGWSDIGDLRPVLSDSDPKERIYERLIPGYVGKEFVAKRKAGEILNLALEAAERDVVVACTGMKVLGIGRVTGQYEFRAELTFPHIRPVEWRAVEPWIFPENEGLQTSFVELGRRATNMLEIERSLAGTTVLHPTRPSPIPNGGSAERSTGIPPLDPLAARIDLALRRRGQVVLYGPPGTGKTYTGLRVARELAARVTFTMTYDSLTALQKATVIGATGGDGLVRLCSFHPGYSYEDFVEGLRPEVANGSMVFKPRDGIFKKLCQDAAKTPDRPHYLIIDEINRGDVPRIFGELMTVLELDKRDQKILLPLAAGVLSVPRNLYIIGTMNTADRSIALLDAALRRRFAFVELMPDPTLLRHLQAGPLGLAEWLAALNQRLRMHLAHDGRSRQVGHAYLLTALPVSSVAAFARVLRDEIVPLLQEYCGDEFIILQEILGTGLVDAAGATIRHDLFEPNREDDLVAAVMTGLEISGAIAPGSDQDEQENVDAPA